MASLFLNNILPRIKQFSATLDQKELFVDKPWAVIDEELNQQKYIFRRSGELIMSLNGQVSMGNWEYLPEAKCILLDRVSDKILLNHNFLDPAVMILKKDGPKNENLILANEVLIPDLDVLHYLQTVIDKKVQEIEQAKQIEREKFRKANNIEIITTPNGRSLELARYRNLTLIGSKIYDNGQLVNDGIIEIKADEFYKVKSGEIISRVVKNSYQIYDGTLVIESDRIGFSKGDLVFYNGYSAHDGKYKLGFLEHITIKDGKIVETSMF